MDILFKHASEITTVLDNLRQTSGAARALILYTHNGGGRPAVDTPIYSSVLFEAARQGQLPVIDKWNKQRVDSEYTRLLGKVAMDGSHEFYVVAMPDNSMLKNIYVSNGVTSSGVYYLYHTTDIFVYLSLTFDREHIFSGSEYQNEVRIALTDMKKIFRKEKKRRRKNFFKRMLSI